MIEITRLDNSTMVVNVEKIQSLQSTPDTVITFTNNVKMIVREPVEEVSEKVEEVVTKKAATTKKKVAKKKTTKKKVAKKASED